MVEDIFRVQFSLEMSLLLQITVKYVKNIALR